MRHAVDVSVGLADSLAINDSERVYERQPVDDADHILHADAHALLDGVGLWLGVADY